MTIEIIRAGETIGRLWGTLFLGVILFGLIGFLFWIWRDPLRMLGRAIRFLVVGTWVSSREAERVARKLDSAFDEAEKRIAKRRRERFTGWLK